MGQSWTLYTPLPRKEAVAVIAKVYAELERLVGRHIVAALKQDDYPEELGTWPELETSTPKVPTPQEERALFAGPNKIGVSFEEAAVERLATCKSRIDIGRPGSLETDPTLVTTLQLLLRAVGPSVLCKNRGFDLITSETLLESLGKARDLPTAILGEDEDDDLDDEDDDDLDDDDFDEDEEEEEDETETEDTTPQALHRMLATISEHAHARRRVGEALARATPDVQSFAHHLAQRGPTTDEVAAAALKLDVRAVGKARRALAELLERAERR